MSGVEISLRHRNWLGNALDKSQRSQIMFMDREHILNLYIGHRLDPPSAAKPKLVDPWSIDDDIPF